MKNKVLQICNAFAGSRVHVNLFTELDKQEVCQIVFNPLRREAEKSKSPIDFICKDSKIVHSNILKKYHRLLFHNKINYLYKSLLQQVNPKEIVISHASTLFSDGAIAYKLYKKYGIPYIVAVRNTDMNLFFKFMFHLRGLGVEILRNAKQIICISPAYRKRLLELPFLDKHLAELKGKCIVMPNGLDDFWLNNKGNRKAGVSDPVKLIFVGSFLKSKNIPLLIKAVDHLNKDKIRFSLDVVGGGGAEEKKVLTLIKSRPYINYHGKIFDKSHLQKIYQSNDIFTMPSRLETFGLVYVEALSQGLPVLYTRNEGIDGFYEGIGESVDCYSVNDIAEGIKKIADNYQQFVFNVDEILVNHSWPLIAGKYKSLYQNYQII